MTLTKLNAAQLGLLELFQHKQFTDSELVELRDVLVHFLAQKLDKELDHLMHTTKLSNASLAESEQALAENRGAYLKKVKS